MKTAERQPVEPGRNLGIDAVLSGGLGGSFHGLTPAIPGNAWKRKWLRSNKASIRTTAGTRYEAAWLFYRLWEGRIRTRQRLYRFINASDLSQSRFPLSGLVL
jgi:hypothetical protein